MLSSSRTWPWKSPIPSLQSKSSIENSYFFSYCGNPVSPALPIPRLQLSPTPPFQKTNNNLLELKTTAEASKQLEGNTWINKDLHCWNFVQRWIRPGPSPWRAPRAEKWQELSQKDYKKGAKCMKRSNTGVHKRRIKKWSRADSEPWIMGRITPDGSSEKRQKS